MVDKENFEKDINVPSKEQVIIDGVDVSECKCLHNVEVIIELAQPEDFEILCGATNGAIKCEKWKDCYFKQLACKTQECEKLKERLERTEEDLKYQCVDCMNVKSDRYRKALDEIEEHYEKVVKNLTTYDDSYDASISIEALHNISDIINKAKGGEDER